MLKKIILISALAAGVVCAWGKPARREPMKVTQSDGTTLTIIKRGDARCHNTFTLDGHPVVWSEGLGYVHAVAEKSGVFTESDIIAHDKSARSEKELTFLSSIDSGAVAEALTIKATAAREGGRYVNRNVRLLPGMGKMGDTRGPGLFNYDFPVKGKQKALVILAQFKDIRFNSKNAAEYKKIDAHTYFSEMLNKEGFSTYSATGSARDWFLENSNGQFDPEFDVFGPVTLPQNMVYYGKNDASGNDLRPHQMVIDACTALDSEINYKDYDRDGDGYVDNVYVFYAGYGEADSDVENSIWPHSWEISSATAPNDYVAGDPLTLDGVKIDRYACSNETMGYIDSYNMANRPDGIGTFVHEFSHVMGLPDLYSTAESSSYRTEPFTPGEFSVMDYGPYNNLGLTPPNYSTYERYALDWLIPEPIKSGDLSLENLADSNHAYIIKTEKEQEFFLLENRQQQGWDEYIPAVGMLVWHIDYEPSKFYDNEVNNTKNHQYVDLVEADNIQDYPTGVDKWSGYYNYPDPTLDGDPFPGAKNVTSFGYRTTPALRSWSGQNLGVEISKIAMSNKKISFHAEVEGSGVDDIEIPSNILNGDIYNLSGTKIGEMKDGKLPSLSNGIYIVKSGELSKKVVI